MKRLLALGALAAAMPASALAGTLAVRSDARVDVMGVVRLLAGDWEGGGSEPDPLLADAKARFGKHAEHAAVKRYRALRERGMRADLPAQFAFHLSAPPELRVAVPLPRMFLQHAGGSAGLEAWLRELRAFVNEAGFMAWRAERKEIFAAREDEVRRALSQEDIETRLVAYLGVRPWRSWTVVPSPFFSQAPAWIVEDHGERADVFVVIDAVSARRSSQPLAAAALPEAVYVAAYAVFELCRAELAGAECGDGAPVATCMERDIVRVIVARLTEKLWGSAARRELQAVFAPGPQGPAVEAALVEFEKRKKGDILDWAGRLAAPYAPEGKAPSCAIGPHLRGFSARRVASALEARLENGKNPALEETIKVLKARVSPD